MMRNGSPAPRVGARPRVEGAHAILDRERGARPVDEAVLFLKARSLAGGALVLRLLMRRPRLELVDDVKDERSAALTEPRLQLAGGFVVVDRDTVDAEDGTGVEAGGHLNNGVAGFGVAIKDGPLHGGGAAVLGQQRAVEVDATEARGGERGRFQNLAVVADDEEVRGQTTKRGAGVLGVDGFGLPDFQAEFAGGDFHRRQLGLAATRWARDDLQNLVSRSRERPQGGNSEGSGAKGDDSHQLVL
jgi:hypothetical protein